MSDAAGLGPPGGPGQLAPPGIGSDAPRLPNRTIIPAMIVLMFCEALSSIEQSMVLTAIPTIARELGDIERAAWLMTAFLLGSVAVIAACARLGDMFGRKRLLLITVVLCLFGSLLSAASTDFNMVVAGRAIQGASSAILPLCYGLARELLEERRARFWIGCLTGAYGIGGSLGFLFGGFLAEQGNWHAIFILTSVYSALLLPALLILLPAEKVRSTSQTFDIVGATLFAPAMAAILYGITLASKWRGDDYEPLFYILGGTIVLAVWARHELRHPAPMIQLRLLARREILIANVCACILSLGMAQTAFLFLMLLQQPAATGIGFGIGATVAGLLKIPSSMVAGFAAPLSGMIAQRRSPSAAIACGALIGTAGWGMLIMFHHSVWHIIAGSIICAASSYMLIAGIPNLALEGAPIERSSEVTALSSILRGLFSALGVQMLALFLAGSQVAYGSSRYPSETAYVVSFAVIAASGLVMAMIVRFARRPDGLTPQLASI